MEWNDLTTRCEKHRRMKLQVKKEARQTKYLDILKRKREHRVSINRLEEFRKIQKEIRNGKTDIETKEGLAIEHVRGSVAPGVPDSGQVTCPSGA